MNFAKTRNVFSAIQLMATIVFFGYYVRKYLKKSRRKIDKTAWEIFSDMRDKYYKDPKDCQRLCSIKCGVVWNEETESLEYYCDQPHIDQIRFFPEAILPSTLALLLSMLILILGVCAAIFSMKAQRKVNRQNNLVY